MTGGGPVGLLAAEAARALGAASVTLTDISEFHLGIAREHGFLTEYSNAPGTASFDVLLECSGAPGVLASSLVRLREAGRASVVGIAKDQSVGLPLSTLNANEITISLVNRYQNTWPLAIALISSGRVNLEGLMTHEFKLSQTAAALGVGGTDPQSMKSIIHPQLV